MRFTLSGTSGTPPQVKRVLACFRWQLKHEVPKAGETGYMPSPLVHSVPNTNGSIEYAAVVPGLPPASRGTGAKGIGDVHYTAVSTVPVADMQVLVELEDNTWFAVVLPVGVTTVVTAIAILLAALLATGVVLWRWAPTALIDPADRRSFRNVSNHILAIISSRDGVASLSQFQIMLWTLVVAGGAVYVMTLSGNLLSISAGTLTLMGIAGGVAVLARVPSGGAPNTPGANAVAAIPSRPLWSQLLKDDPTDTEIDVTRLQMLIFTLITSAFVAIKIAVTYSIPEIPDNFLVLMGISNGVYIAGRQIPSPTKGKSTSAGNTADTDLSGANGETGPPAVRQ